MITEFPSHGPQPAPLASENANSDHPASLESTGVGMVETGPHGWVCRPGLDQVIPPPPGQCFCPDDRNCLASPSSLPPVSFCLSGSRSEGERE